MYEVFDWPVRWQGQYLAAVGPYILAVTPVMLLCTCSKEATDAAPDSYNCLSGLNHIGLVVADLDLVESQVRKGGFTPQLYSDYPPGRRFYFKDHDEIEYEVVQY